MDNANILRSYAQQLSGVNKAAPLPADTKAELDALSKRDAELSLLQRQATGLSETDLKERETIRKRIKQIQGASQMTKPATPSAPVGGPLRYQLINGAYQLTQ